jgi:hypothetical protein
MREIPEVENGTWASDLGGEMYVVTKHLSS